MNEVNTPKITPFDLAISQDSLQMLKGALPYLPVSLQKTLAIYAKFRELSNTVSYFRAFTPELQMMSSKQSLQPLDVLSELRQYTNPQMQGNIDQILFAFQAIQLMQDMPSFEQEVS